MTEEFDKILALIPHAMGVKPDWDAFMKTPLGGVLGRMSETMQNPEWHGEGDVITHTKMVIDALLSDSEYYEITNGERETVFLAALLHDIGKTVTTVEEGGVLRSPRHTIVGAKMARELLWRELSLGGTPEKRELREAISTLIRQHGMPIHTLEKADPARDLIRMAAMGELIPRYSLRLLSMLVRADLKGRIASDTEDQLMRSSLTFMLAEEIGILDKPYPFPDSATRHAYLSGKSIPRDYPIYDTSICEVIMLAGLPGTGKDTYISEHFRDLPMISLDEIRREMHVSPTDKDGQGAVANRARELMKRLLREKRSFVFNATNITADMRNKYTELFHKYGAKTRIIFLETSLEETERRNEERTDRVPYPVILSLLKKLELPTLTEARDVEWVTV